MMGKRTRVGKVLWCLWLIPVLTTCAKSLSHEKEGNKLENSSFPIISERVILLGVTSVEQPRGSFCDPKHVVELTNFFHPDIPDILNDARIHGGHGRRGTNGKLFICSMFCPPDNEGQGQGGQDCLWIHQGETTTLKLGHLESHPPPPPPDTERSGLKKSITRNEDVDIENFDFENSDLEDMTKRRNKRGTDAPPTVRRPPAVEILGMAFEYESDKKRVEYDRHGSAKILENMAVKIRLFGKFDDTTYFKLSKFQKCDDPNNRELGTKVIVDPTKTMGEVEITMPHMGELHELFSCLWSSNVSSHYVRQGEDLDGLLTKPWLVIKLYQAMLPVWLHLSLLTVLLVLSGLFSGLNLGLMSLNKTDLKIIINTGTSSERHHASAIAPVRNHGNFLLCCLLFSNVLVNASLTILVDDLTSGLIAIMCSTLAIVIFGEIIPQAICSRHGLAVGAKTIYVTKFFMIITFPLAYPLSKILDKMLGEEIGSVYTRERLKELLRVTKDYHGLETEEVGIISGALEMKTKTVKDIMVRLDNVFMLPIDAVLDFDTMAEVEYHGYSRIPVYEHNRSNIVALLNVKQLTLLDANDNIPLKTVVEYYQNKLFFVFENTRLDYMFRTFREGSRGHMAFVQKINDEGPGDPFYETMGLVTMEDVLEELLQAEIMDESDIGKHEARLANASSVRPKTTAPSDLIKRKPKPPVEIPQPLALAAVQFLNTSVEPFRKEIMSVSILHRLVKNCCQYIKLPKHRGNQSLPELLLYEAGKPSEFFIMILEGRVEVTVGKEKLTYESGAFTTFGKDFLVSELAVEKSGATSPVSTEKPTETKSKRRTFIPDYTVRVVTDLHYLMLKYSAYKAAMLATGIEKANADPSKSQNKNWQDEIEKMLEGGGGDDDTTSETSRRPKLSVSSDIPPLLFSIEVIEKFPFQRDDSCRTTYVIVGENEGISRKTSCAVIGENETGLGDHVTEQTKLI